MKKKLKKERGVGRKDIEDLKQRLFLADLFAPQFPKDMIGLRISNVRHVAIHVYAKEADHKEPHFHARLNNQESASYRIKDAEKLSGELPRHLEHVIVAWAKIRTAQLLVRWDQAQAGQHPWKIEC